MCHGDVSLVYWWNHNYSYVDDQGTKRYTKLYEDKTPEERAKGSFAMWDTEVQCRDLGRVQEWVEERRMEEGKYRDLMGEG